MLHASHGASTHFMSARLPVPVLLLLNATPQHEVPLPTLCPHAYQSHVYSCCMQHEVPHCLYPLYVLTPTSLSSTLVARNTATRGASTYFMCSRLSVPVLLLLHATPQHEVPLPTLCPHAYQSQVYSCCTQHEVPLPTLCPHAYQFQVYSCCMQHEVPLPTSSRSPLLHASRDTSTHFTHAYQSQYLL